MAVDPNFRTLRRRAKEELLIAAKAEIDDDSKALCLFYAVECGLKALYMDLHKLATASASGGRARSARSFDHRLDALIVELRIPASKVSTRPPHLNLRSNEALQVRDLHEAWRYGEKIDSHVEVTSWLNQIAAHMRQELG
jgi:hypothetical protein